MQRVTLIDNYDSFTFNLVHYLGELGAEVSVWRNDEITVADTLASRPDAIVLSPGPCTPNEAGVCLDLVRSASETTPMLGVCLGHQAIGQAFGGDIVRAPAPMHGKVSRISHHARGLFRGLNGPFQATRYHSLIIERASTPSNSRSPPKATMGSSWALSTATARFSEYSSIRRASPASTGGKSCAISWTWRPPFISASRLSEGERETGSWNHSSL
jgi:anthranilate synthase component 2